MSQDLGYFSMLSFRLPIFLRHRLPRGWWLPFHNILCLVSKYRIM